MAVTPIYVDDPHRNFPRTYIAGIALYIAPSISSWDQHHILFHDPILGVDWDLKVSDIFSPPTSNVYSLDHVMDFPNSYARIAGVPVGAGCYVTFGIVINKGMWWVGLQPLSELTTPPKLVELNQVSNYWLPLDDGT